MFVCGIAIKPEKRGPMREVSKVMVTCEAGLKGDCRGAGGTTRKRQITVLSIFQWEEACQELKLAWLPWTTRRANLLIREDQNREFRFGPDHVGRRFYISSGLVLEITGETDPCSRMDEAYPGLKTALRNWRGGVTCRVEWGGQLQYHNIVRMI